MTAPGFMDSMRTKASLMGLIEMMFVEDSLNIVINRISENVKFDYILEGIPLRCDGLTQIVEGLNKICSNERCSRRSASIASPSRN